MIELTSTTATMLYLCLTLWVVLFIWCYDHYKSRRKKIVLVEQEVIVCEFCRFVYLNKISKKISQCPQCFCYNKNEQNLKK